MLKLRYLEVFRAVMKTGSLTEAGRSLQMSQPAVSKVLRHMEDLLGFELFWRAKGRVRPTAEAEGLFEEVDKLFHNVTVLERYASDLKDAQSGILRLAATPTLSYTFLARAIAAFRRHRPKVRVWLQLATTAQVLELAASHHIDLGLIYAPAKDDSLEVMPLFDAEIVCVLPADHPLAARPVIEPADLDGIPIITNVRNEPIHALLRRAFGVFDVDRHVMIGANNSMTTCSLVEAGAGVGLIEPFGVAERYPTLVRRPLRPQIRITTRVVYSRHRPLSRVSTAFLDLLRAEVEADPGVTGLQRTAGC